MGSPLVDWYQRVGNQAGNALNRFTAPLQHGVQGIEGLLGYHPQALDTSGHDQMVQEANQSFAPRPAPPAHGVLTRAAKGGTARGGQ